MPTALVTGSNRGIGLELCKQLLEKGYTVIACCRKKSKELTSLPLTIYENVDVTEEKARKDLFNQIQNSTIDLLINNAGILVRDEENGFSADSFMRQYETNAVAPFLFTREIVPILPTEAKIVMISSSAGSITLKENAKMYGYRASKCALNMLGRLLSFDLYEKKVPLLLIHPGYVKTDMTRHEGHITVDTSVKGIIHQIEKLTLKNSGSFVSYNGEKMPW